MSVASESYAQGAIGAHRQRIIDEVMAEIEGQNWSDEPITEREKTVIVMAVMGTFAKLVRAQKPST